MNEVWTPKPGDRVLVENWQGIGTIHSTPAPGIARVLFDDHSGRAEVPFHELTLKEKTK